MYLELDNKLVLVTGSTSGIGYATAKAFLREGARVIVHGIEDEEVNLTVNQLKHDYENEIFGITADLTDTKSVNEMIEFIDSLGSLNILINNVGIFNSQDFFEITDDDWEKYFNINFMSALRLSRHYLKIMLSQNEGRIINIASESGIKPLPLMVHYSVTKTAIISLSRGMAELTKGSNVTVNSILPGPTWTKAIENFMKTTADAKGQTIEQFTADYFKENEPTSLIQRFGTVEEISNTILYMASPLASAINGSSLRSEGGIIRSI